MAVEPLSDEETMDLLGGIQQAALVLKIDVEALEVAVQTLTTKDVRRRFMFVATDVRLVRQRFRELKEHWTV